MSNTIKKTVYAALEKTAEGGAILTREWPKSDPDRYVRQAALEFYKRGDHRFELRILIFEKEPGAPARSIMCIKEQNFEEPNWLHTFEDARVLDALRAWKAVLEISRVDSWEPITPADMFRAQWLKEVLQTKADSVEEMMRVWLTKKRILHLIIPPETNNVEKNTDMPNTTNTITKKPCIVTAKITPSNPSNNLFKASLDAKFDDGTEKQVLTYFDDELSFQASEFIGKTEDECWSLFTKKDLRYLQS